MAKKTIGYTTGVFDLFHTGHLNILKKASEHCDYLIVGVTSDQTVFNYKKRYPMIPLEERIEIIKSIKYVDKTVVQNSMDKIKAYELYKFDKLFHGNDWKDSNMYNEIEKKLHNLGVDIIYFEYTKGTSTSILKKHIYYEVKNEKENS
ncbi:adenylyltransferase/cytidyltransferase family protein [Flavobacteriaceae bacterium]|jgi:glycerol-3-phosphate cytidylyltransferase|nr:adenylyltransferase/cytidyltransferase family protein [Flavobacteriaceae bacterium]